MLRGILPYYILQYIIDNDLQMGEGEEIKLPPMDELATEMGISRGKLREEMAELEKLIKYLQGLLKSPAKRRKLIATELAEGREKYADERRSRIIPDDGDMSLEDLIADEEIIVTVTANGYLKAVNANSYRRLQPGCSPR